MILLFVIDKLEAHKVILSASSPFFKSVIKRNPHAHPLIYLKGVKIEDMKALIDFIYLGQTKVCQEDVQAFLVLGEELGVKGLARNKQIANIRKLTKDELPTSSLEFEEDDTRNKAKNSKETNVGIKMEEHLSIDMNTDDTNTSDNIRNIVLEEKVDNQLDITDTSDTEEQCADVSIDADLDAQVENYITKATNAKRLTGYQCTTCYKFSLKKQNMKKH